MLSRTEFWVILAVVVTFVGCVFIVNAALDVEALLALEEAVLDLNDALERIKLFSLDFELKPEVTPPGVIVVTATPALPIPTPTP